jgi:hypothetical protein
MALELFDVRIHRRISDLDKYQTSERIDKLKIIFDRKFEK